jgi:hypothetical protein
MRDFNTAALAGWVEVVSGNNHLEPQCFQN